MIITHGICSYQITLIYLLKDNVCTWIKIMIMFKSAEFDIFILLCVILQRLSLFSEGQGDKMTKCERGLKLSLLETWQLKNPASSVAGSKNLRLSHNLHTQENNIYLI